MKEIKANRATSVKAFIIGLLGSTRQQFIIINVIAQ